MGMLAMNNGQRIKSAVRKGASSGKRLQFATIEKYTTCKGYSYPVTPEIIMDLKQGGYSLTDAEKQILSSASNVHWTQSEPRISFTTSIPVQPTVPQVSVSQVMRSTDAQPSIQFTINDNEAFGRHDDVPIMVQQSENSLDHQVAQWDTE
jgi:hypothetical protein